MAKITPSVLTCDTVKMYEEISKLENAGIDWLHFDIMDGHFVNNFGLSPKQLDDIKHHFPNMIIDAHVMANDIESNIPLLKNADYITFHANSIQSNGFDSLINKIKKQGCKVGIGVDLDNNLEDIRPFLKDADLITIMSIKPGFTGQEFNKSTWETIALFLEFCSIKPNLKIQVDGGVRWDNIKKLIDMGVHLIVVGSLMFGENDYSLVMQRISNL